MDRWDADTIKQILCNHGYTATVEIDVRGRYYVQCGKRQIRSGAAADNFLKRQAAKAAAAAVDPSAR